MPYIIYDIVHINEYLPEGLPTAELLNFLSNSSNIEFWKTFRPCQLHFMNKKLYVKFIQGNVEVFDDITDILKYPRYKNSEFLRKFDNIIFDKRFITAYMYFNDNLNVDELHIELTGSNIILFKSETFERNFKNVLMFLAYMQNTYPEYIK